MRLAAAIPSGQPRTNPSLVPCALAQWAALSALCDPGWSGSMGTSRKTRFAWSQSWDSIRVSVGRTHVKNGQWKSVNSTLVMDAVWAQAGTVATRTGTARLLPMLHERTRNEFWVKVTRDNGFWVQGTLRPWENPGNICAEFLWCTRRGGSLWTPSMSR